MVRKLLGHAVSIGIGLPFFTVSWAVGYLVAEIANSIDAGFDHGRRSAHKFLKSAPRDVEKARKAARALADLGTSTKKRDVA